VDFFEVVRTRRSIRVFENRPVEEEKLHAILEATNAAPSAGNLQAYEIYLVKDPAARGRLAKTIPNMAFFSVVPVVLAFCVHPGRAMARYRERGEKLYALQDATIACTHAMLAATALGLGSVWVGAFRDQEVSEALKLPGSVTPVALLPIGYPAETVDARSRRALEEIVHSVK
jgi:nitroreductase